MSRKLACNWERQRKSRRKAEVLNSKRFVDAKEDSLVDCLPRLCGRKFRNRISLAARFVNLSQRPRRVSLRAVFVPFLDPHKHRRIAPRFFAARVRPKRKYSRSQAGIARVTQNLELAQQKSPFLWPWRARSEGELLYRPVCSVGACFPAHRPQKR